MNGPHRLEQVASDSISTVTEIDADAVIGATKISRVSLEEGRPAIVAETLSSIAAEASSMFALNLGETHPASTFAPGSIG